ncbi:MAG TPA: translocation/assembly module TamB domain-containing protein [Thermoanaerobaculia bacterium]|nr:translocation/assembly module TamB domain-containing protein [Thermoanaerobaculia bacterium]
MSYETPSPAPPAAAPPAAPPKKKRRILRWTLRLLLMIFVPLILGVVLVLYAVTTERGTRVLLTRLAKFIPGTLTVGAQHGPLTGPLDLRDVHYKTDTMDVRIGHLALAWHPRELRSRQLDVESLHAEGIRIVLPPTKTDTSDGKLVDIHLPVNIVVRDALIKDLEISHTAPPGQPVTPPFRLDQIALDAQSDRLRDLLHVRSLKVDGPTFRLRASGDVKPVGAYDLDLQADATYNDPQLPPVAVSGTFRGTLEKLGVAVRLTQPFPAEANGDVLTPMREVGLDLAAHVRNVDTKALNATWPAARISEANVTIKGKLNDFLSAGTVAGSYEDFGAAVAKYRLARRGDDFLVESLNLKTANGSDLTAKGTIGTAKKELDLDVVADWRGFAYPLQGKPVVVSRQGDAKVKGTLNAYQVDLNADLAGPGIPPGRWKLSGRGDQEKMTLRSLQGDVLRGRLTAEGLVAWKPQVTWKVKVNGQNLDPGAFAPQYPGQLTFAATSDGSLKNGNPYGQVDVTDLSGNLRGNPVAGRVRLELAGDRYGLPRLDLRSGSARLTASGSFTKTAANLDFRLEAPNLGEALPQAGGAITLQGNLSGPFKAPHVRAQGNGQSLVYQTYDVSTLALNADVDLAPQGTILLDLNAANVGAAGRRFDSLVLAGRGTQASHTVTLAVKAPEGTLDLGLAGGLQGTTSWSGQIQRLDFKNQQTGNWSLAGPAGLTAGTTAAALRNFCWTSGNARLCADGQWSKTGPWSGSGTIASLPFSLFKPFLPPDLVITGDVNGSFRGQGTAGGFVTANVDLRPGPGEVRYPLESGETARVRFDQGAVTLAAGQDGLSGHAVLTFPDTGKVDGTLRLPQFNSFGAPLQQQNLQGRIVANFTNLGLVEAFVPDLKNPKGTLNADLTLGGTVAAPRAVGAVELKGAQVDVPQYGLQVRQIELAAKSDGQGALQVNGSATSGGGNVTIAGTVPLDQKPASLTVEGRRFVAANSKEVRVVVTPHLKIAVQYPKVDVTGDVDVPEAAFNQQKSKRAAIPVSKDVVIVPPSAQQSADATKKPLELTARVRVVLGEKVTIAASGFTGRPYGSLLIIEQPGKPTSAVGELQIANGIYKAYGQDLTLDHGRLIFAGGPVDNPGLDLQAYRTATDGTIAGINVKGTLKSPQATLYSTPPMGQSDQLAYLLLGHPLGQSTPQEGNLVANAATSLGLKGGDLIAKKIAARFGLEEARIESSGGLQDASLVVGKYLSPRLYVTYGIGLFEPISTFRIRYILGRVWTLQAEQGTGTSADFLYDVERGKGLATPRPGRSDPKEPVKLPPADNQSAGSNGG